MFSPKITDTYNSDRSLYTTDGQRKYLNEQERSRFIVAAERQRSEVKLLCLVLVFTGCRLTEALDLTIDNLLVGENVIAIRSLKKRNKVVFRHIPLPPAVITELLNLRKKNRSRLFNWGRTRGLFHVKAVMAEAGIFGVRATARGLRHTFGTYAIVKGIPVTLLQRWYGHSKIQTTAIYTEFLGPEERSFALKMWSK